MFWRGFWVLLSLHVCCCYFFLKETIQADVLDKVQLLAKLLYNLESSGHFKSISMKFIQ